MRLEPSRWKSAGTAIINYWRPSLFGAIGLAAVGVLLSFKLATLVPAFSGPEIEARAASATVQSLQADPLYAPHKVVQLSFHYFDHHGPLAMRAAGSIIGMAVVIGFYYVMSRWYTRRTALLTTLLFATSAWFLHTVRLSTPDATFLLLFLFFVCGVWLQQSHRSRLAFIAAVLAALALFYIPGMIWFLIPAFIWQRRRIFEALGHVPVWQLIILLLVGAVVLAPLVLAFVRQPGLYKSWLGLPINWPGFTEMLRNLLSTPMQLIWRGPDDPVRWLGTLPLLDWFSVLMFIIGGYAHWLKLHLDRTWLFLYVAIVGIILVSLNGPVSLALIMPFVYIVVGSGVALLLQQWFTVFPRNPVAKGIGLTFMIIAVLGSSLYNLDHYFVAWPNAPETKAVFQNQP